MIPKISFLNTNDGLPGEGWDGAKRNPGEGWEDINK